MSESWYNLSTRLAFHAVLEEWDNLEALAGIAKDNPVELALRIRQSFARAFQTIPSPFLRRACQRALGNVNFREVAERLLAMLARQRQHLARRGGTQP